MGNVVQCCQALGNYIKRKEGPGDSVAERSPLLSSEGSGCDSVTPLDDPEEDLLMVQALVTSNPALERGHFLFPDIILSSSMGLDVAVVDPMVCLLVSEDDRGEVEGKRDEGGERKGERTRPCMEVETQTEAETPTGTEAETQTETQAEVQTLTTRGRLTETVKQSETDSAQWTDRLIQKQAEILLEVQTHTASISTEEYTHTGTHTVDLNASATRTASLNTETQNVVEAKVHTTELDLERMKAQTELRKATAAATGGVTLGLERLENEDAERGLEGVAMETEPTAVRTERNHIRTHWNPFLTDHCSNETLQNLNADPYSGEPYSDSAKRYPYSEEPYSDSAKRASYSEEPNSDSAKQDPYSEEPYSDSAKRSSVLTELSADQWHKNGVQMEPDTCPTEPDTCPTEPDAVPTVQNVDPAEQNLDLTEEHTVQINRITPCCVDPAEQNVAQTEENFHQAERNMVQTGAGVDWTEQNRNQTEQSPAQTELNVDPAKDDRGQSGEGCVTEQNSTEPEPDVTRVDQTSIELDLTQLDQTSTVPGETKVVETSKEPDPSQVDQTSREPEPGVTQVDQTSREPDPSQVDQTSKEPDPSQVDQTSTEPDLAETQVDEVDAGTQQMALFLVDRLFLSTPHMTAPPSLTPGEEEGPEKEQGEGPSIQEVISLQEAELTVKIQAPGTEIFELQVSSRMLVAELQQVLMDHEVTCHRTCFSLQLEGAVLDSMAELNSVQAVQEGALFKVVEDPYTVRDARLHLRHVRDLLRSLDPTDAYTGVNGSSLSHLSLYTQADMESEGAVRRQASEKESVDCSPPDYVLPGCKDCPLVPLHPMREDWKPLQCLRVLTVSSWNPPPGNRKMHGDLMYLNAVTMEERDLNVTASTRGFYLNQSTAFTFNPKPACPKILCHNLVDLLSQVSPAFRKCFSTLQKKRVLRHPYERIATPFQVFTWAAPQRDHTLDCVRSEETHTIRMGQEEHTAGQSHDWNEELQACRELPRIGPQERLHRERNLFKTTSDLVAAATRGAVAVVDGNVMAINPGEDPRAHMFIWNSLFFSLGFDVRDHYRPLGGDAAAHAAVTCDLRGVQAYASIDQQGLHTIGTTVVDYRGYRVTAQTIVPGILEKEQEDIVVYGSNDYGKTVRTHPRFVELLDQTSQPMRIQRHQVLDHAHLPVELCSSVETKGILGNDGRPYILDILRAFPPDLNFYHTQEREEEEDKEEEEEPPERNSCGFPRRHGHGLASLRAELLEAFILHRYETFLKTVSQGLSQLEAGAEGLEDPGRGPVTRTEAAEGEAGELVNKSQEVEEEEGVPKSKAEEEGRDPGTRIQAEEEEEGVPRSQAEEEGVPRIQAEEEDRVPRIQAEEAAESAAVAQNRAPDQGRMEELEGAPGAGAGTNTGTDHQRAELMRRACLDVGSISDCSFDIRFNPDVCSPGVRFPAECAEDVQQHKRLLKDAATFLLSNQIPAVLQDFLDHTALPVDGRSLTAELHLRGVNVRYLGTLLELLEESEERERLGHVQRLAVSEVITRSAKHIFRRYLQEVELSSLSSAVSHFLNCLLSSSSSCSDSTSDELLSRRKSRRRRSHGNRVAVVTDTFWARLTPDGLWRKIRKEAEEYFHYTLRSQSFNEVTERFGLQRISLLREMALKTGIQVQLREYVFDSRHRAVFGEEDVVNMFPVVTHMRPTSSDATHLLQQSQVAVQQGHLKEGTALIGQALSLLSSVCGVLHMEVCLCLRLLARLSYILGEYAEALRHQEKVVLITERVQGVDHHQTIQDYCHLALYCFAGGQHSISLRLLYRARYLTLLLCGEDHPQVALLDSMLGLVLYGLQEYDLSLRFLHHALSLSSKYHGASSLNHALSYHILATVYESKSDFRSALQHEREAYSIYKTQVGEEHQSTRESSAYLKSLTQQAVLLQRAINHIYCSGPASSLAPPKFTSPSIPMILQQLNLTCKIILIPLSTKDIEELRAELKGKEIAQVQELERQLKLAERGYVDLWTTTPASTTTTTASTTTTA